MKSLFLMLFFVLSPLLFAKDVENISDRDSRLPVARIVNLTTLVNHDNLKVMVTVYDHGGSTDVSPTQQLFFSLYLKGEMFSTDAAFDLGAIFELKSARRLSGGIYEILISGADEESSMPVDKILTVDAQKAIIQMRNVQCEDFDCDASTHFKSVINVTEK